MIRIKVPDKCQICIEVPKIPDKVPEWCHIENSGAWRFSTVPDLRFLVPKVPGLATLTPSFVRLLNTELFSSAMLSRVHSIKYYCCRPTNYLFYIFYYRCLLLLRYDYDVV